MTYIYLSESGLHSQPRPLLSILRKSHSNNTLPCWGRLKKATIFFANRKSLCIVNLSVTLFQHSDVIKLYIFGILKFINLLMFIGHFKAFTTLIFFFRQHSSKRCLSFRGPGYSRACAAGNGVSNKDGDVSCVNLAGASAEKSRKPESAEKGAFF